MAARTQYGISLCSGLGGAELGLGLATGGAFVPAVHVEIEAFVAAGLVARMAAGLIRDAPVWSSVATFDGKPWRGKVDWLSAGFSCQPFSAAGNRRGTGDDRWIWPDIRRIIEESEPWCVCLENVPGLIAGPVDSGPEEPTSGLAVVLGDLVDLGFDAE